MNLLDFIFPKMCVGCGRVGGYFCSDCIQKIEQTELICPKCEKPSLGGLVHPICQRKYGLSGLWSLGIYQGSLKKGIQKLKYKFVRELAEVLIDILVEYWAIYQPLLLQKITKDHGQNWIITSVPLHSRRQNWRGFNQSEELGRLLASKLGLRYENLLTRVKYTKPQVGLLGSDRQKNIRGAFQLTINSYQLPVNVILIDDVWTTGSTLKECDYVLKKAGAKSVWALTLAR